ncbi:MAG: lycopene beta-cyclase CrtY [Deltaproteobacteria bacterium]|nr:lycopene beta-cyclase CrtY [Deltaproteobacteria bacterium]
MTTTTTYDYVLVGGGLQSGLIALAVLHHRPDARLLLIERERALGGNHTWSFHEGTVPEAAWPWFRPLVEHRWPRYRVRFPDLERVVEHPYATCSSAHFERILTTTLARHAGAELRLGAEVAAVAPDHVVLADGARLDARLVVDARGPRSTGEGVTRGTGYQKFVGLEVVVDADLDLSSCELMDATVPQRDGFRFVYLLPFDRRRALVEDTRFASGPELDVDELCTEVHAWLGARGLSVVEIVRRESGVLPMPWRSAGPIPRQPPLVGGYRGGWFHPATGYSVPVALRLACFVAERAPDEVFAGDAFDRLATAHEAQARFGHLLNDLLFNAAEPAARWKVFRHFYELEDDLVLRFYGATLAPADKRRMFLRKPPPGVSFLKAAGIFARWGFR